MPSAGHEDKPQIFFDVNSNDNRLNILLQKKAGEINEELRLNEDFHEPKVRAQSDLAVLRPFRFRRFR